MTDPFTGDLDGERIEVDHDQSCEDAVAHLFGHTVQWNTDPGARAIGSVVTTNPSEELLAELCDYEQKACRYRLRLFHDAGIRDLAVDGRLRRMRLGLPSAISIARERNGRNMKDAG